MLPEYHQVAAEAWKQYGDTASQLGYIRHVKGLAAGLIERKTELSDAANDALTRYSESLQSAHNGSENSSIRRVDWFVRNDHTIPANKKDAIAQELSKHIDPENFYEQGIFGNNEFVRFNSKAALTLSNTPKTEERSYGEVPHGSYSAPIPAGGAGAAGDEKDGWGTWLKKSGPMGAALAGAAMGFSSGGIMGAIIGFLIGMMAGNFIMHNTPVGNFLETKVNGLTGGKGRSPSISTRLAVDREINTNADGLITEAELQTGIETKLSRTNADAVLIAGDLLKQFDTNNDKGLDATELGDLASKIKDGSLVLPADVKPEDIQTLLAPKTPAGKPETGARRH